MSLKKMYKDILRKEAKKIYKEQTKSIPKRSRIPFPEFFKKYLATKKGKTDAVAPEPEGEDFDFDNFVNINEISDEELDVVEETTEKE